SSCAIRIAHWRFKLEPRTGALNSNRALALGRYHLFADVSKLSMEPFGKDKHVVIVREEQTLVLLEPVLKHRPLQMSFKGLLVGKHRDKDNFVFGRRRKTGHRKIRSVDSVHQHKRFLCANLALEDLKRGERLLAFPFEYCPSGDDHVHQFFIPLFFSTGRVVALKVADDVFNHRFERADSQSTNVRLSGLRSRGISVSGSNVDPMPCWN